MRPLKLLTLILCFFVFTVFDGQSAEITPKPEELNGVIAAPKPFGSGRLQIFFISPYDAELWLDSERWSWQNSFALVLRYHIAIDRNKLTSVSLDRMQDIFPLSPSDKESLRNQFSKIFPDIQNGDRITALYSPNKGITFYDNGRLLGVLSDIETARHFLSIWLDERTPNPDLRQQLLSLKSPS